MAETATQIEAIEPELKDPFNVDNLLTSVDVATLWQKKNEPIVEPEVKVEEPIIEQKVEAEPIKVETPEVAPLVFANEESEKLYNLIREGKIDEVRQTLNDRDLYANVDKLKADEAIRLRIQKSNPDYTKEDIQDVMEEKYYIPEKPEKDVLDDDADYDRKLATWQNQSDKINRRIERDAREARQELAKNVKELSLPEINVAPKEDNQLSPEEWKKIEGLRQEYLKGLDLAEKSSIVFDAKYKDDEVELPVSFEIPEQYKRQIRKELENFDLQAYFEQRYFTEGKGFDTNKLIKERFVLDHLDVLLNEIATKAGAERFVASEKARKNIKIGGNDVNVALQNDSLMDRLAKKMLTS